MNEDPLVSITKGDPTPEELAALLAVLVSRSNLVDKPARRPSMSAWVRSSRPAAGPGSWRAAGLPSGH